MQGTPMKVTALPDGLDLWFDFVGPWSYTAGDRECEAAVHVDAHHPEVADLATSLDPLEGRRIAVLADKGRVGGEWTLSQVAQGGDHVQITLRRPEGSAG